MAELKGILQAFNSQFPSLNRWLKKSSNSELIVDDESFGCIFTPLGSAQGFVVNNPSSCPFCLIQIDNRLLPQEKGGQCDGCIVYDNGINLLEFKTNTTTFNKSTVKKRYSKAEKQLKNTIKRFKNNGLDISSLASDLEAFICFNNTFPRMKASEINRSIRFALETGGVGLSFDNNKTL